MGLLKLDHCGAIRVEIPKFPRLAGRNDFVIDELLGDLVPEVGHELELFPTFSYFRMYREGDAFQKYKDRPACEISRDRVPGLSCASALADLARWAGRIRGNLVGTAGANAPTGANPSPVNAPHYVDQKTPMRIGKLTRRQA